MQCWTMDNDMRALIREFVSGIVLVMKSVSQDGWLLHYGENEMIRVENNDVHKVNISTYYKISEYYTLCAKLYF